MNRVSRRWTISRYCVPNVSDAFEIPRLYARTAKSSSPAASSRRSAIQWPRNVSPPIVVVIGILQVHVHEAKLVQLPHSVSGEVGRSGKSDFPASVSVDEGPSMLEPRLGHDDR